MAKNQFQVVLVPRDWFLAHNNPLKRLVSSEGWNTSTAFDGFTLHHDLNEYLHPLFTKATSWHENLAIWGDINHSDFQIWYEGSNIESMAFRLDPKVTTHTTFETVSKIGHATRCMFFYPEFMRFEIPSETTLEQALANSRAYMYCVNPEAVLRERSDDA